MFDDVDVIILAAGFGTRISSVFSDRPKVLVPIGKKVFIDIVLENLIIAGFQSFIFSVGYKKEMIEEYIQKKILAEKLPIKIKFSRLSDEEVSFGTGFSFKRAISFSEKENILSVNGDTFCDVDHTAFYSFYKKSGKPFTMLLNKSIRNDAGLVDVDQNGTIKSFLSEAGSLPFMNAGHYFVERKEIVPRLASFDRFSFERDFFPELVEEKSMHGFVTESEVYDIGTPGRYEKFKEMFLAGKI